MRKSKRTVVTVEVEQELVVRARRPPARAWCAACAAEVSAVGPGEAAALASNTTWAVRRWVEEKKLHFAETPAGELRLCLPSLLACAFGADAPDGDEPDAADFPDTPAQT